MPTKLPIPSKSELEELYVNQGLTLKQVGEHYGVSYRTVRKWLIKKGIPRRHPAAVLGLMGSASSHWEGGIHISRGRVYIYQPNHPRAHIKGCYVSRAILNWEAANHQPFPEGKEPHHDNEIKDDDRPENIIPLTHSEHMKLHRLRQLARRNSHQI